MVDYLLLDALQNDATRSQSEFAEIAGMSQSSVWRRVKYTTVTPLKP